MSLVGRARIVVAILAAALVCTGGAAAASGWTEVTITASDSTPLACAYIVPSGTAPTGGWPGVILFHGLGQSHTDMEPIGTAMAQFGFASLACDARGTGGSGGKFGLDGPTETQDARDLFNWFAARSDVSNTQIGAFGLSLGGGAVWNAAVAGVPFKAIVPAITWTESRHCAQPRRRAEVRARRDPLPGRTAGEVGPDPGPDRPDAAAGRGNTGGHELRSGSLVAVALARADRADPPPAGTARLPLRHGPGDYSVEDPRRPEAPLPRRPRPRAGHEPGGGAGRLRRRGHRLVRPLPRRRPVAPTRHRACPRSMGRHDDGVQEAAGDPEGERQPPQHGVEASRHGDSHSLGALHRRARTRPSAPALSLSTTRPRRTGRISWPRSGSRDPARP